MYVLLDCTYSSLKLFSDNTLKYLIQKEGHLYERNTMKGNKGFIESFCYLEKKKKIKQTSNKNQNQNKQPGT